MSRVINEFCPWQKTAIKVWLYSIHFPLMDSPSASEFEMLSQA